MRILLDIAISLFLTFIGIVIALWYENLGSPKLEITPGKTTDDVKDNGWRTRFLHLNVTNKPKKRIPLVTRQTASSCHGTISFLTLDKKQAGKAMPIRWDGNPEPIIPEIIDNKIVYLPDPRLIRLSRYIEIPPDETESLAVAIRIHGDANTYGWTSESYFHNWRHPEYELLPGEYIVRVCITSGDNIFRKDFQFTNPETFDAFDLKH